MATSPLNRKSLGNEAEKIMNFMKRIRRAIAVLACANVMCCTAVSMPSNVTTTPGNAGGDYIKSIDFSYQSNPAASFDKLKLCVAENVSNRAVQLTGSSGSLVDAASGQHHDVQHTQTVQGGDIFKYADASLATLIATGTIDSGPAARGLTRDIIMYDLKASAHGQQVGLAFTNITRAQQSTGEAANEGFSPVGTWREAYPERAYAALEVIANGIKSCLR